MSKKLQQIFFVKILTITVAVLCAFTFSSVQAREFKVCNNNISNSVYTLKLVAKHNNGQIKLSDEEVLKIKKHALQVFESASRQIAEFGLSETDIARYEKILPQSLIMRLHAVIEVSQLNLSPEEKVKTLMQIQGDNC